MLPINSFHVDSRLKKKNKEFFGRINEISKSDDVELIESSFESFNSGIMICRKDTFDRDFFKFSDELKSPFLLGLLEDSQPGLDFIDSGNKVEQFSGNIVTFKNSSEFEQCYPLFLQFLQYYSQSRHNPLLKKSFIDLKEISHGAKRFIERASYSPDNIQKMSKLFQDVYELVLGNFGKESKGNIKDIITFFNRSIIHGKFEVLKDFANYQKFDRIIKVSLNDGKPYFLGVSLKKGISSFEDYDCFVIGLFLSIQELYDSSLKSFVFSNEKNEVISDVFSSLPISCALFSEDGELLIYNNLFLELKISPAECLQFEDGRNFKVADDRYLCHRTTLKSGNSSYQLFFFLNQKKQFEESRKGEKGSVLNPKELGIITSSIAHELNNPLAGILTAISYLKMEDEYSEEQKRALDEMEQSAKRCKNLVEVFLGFSRAQNTEFSKRPLSESYENALSLLNFRVVETNIKLAVNWNVSDYFNEKFLVNPSIFSMIFYILFGDLLTAFSHDHLVRGSKQIEEPTLGGVIFDKYNSLVIDVEQNIANYLKDLEFVSFLLRLEGHYLEHRESTIRITFNSER